jgi:outer membrane immunogenic protein
MKIREPKMDRQSTSGLRFATLMILAIIVVGLNSIPAWAQSLQRLELGGAFSFVDTNAPPGKCGCFQTLGGAGWVGYSFSPNLAIAGEVGSSHASNINGTAADLTLTSFLAGPRYSLRRWGVFVPFGQVLIGGAHASGALTPTASGTAGSANAFAMAAGGGLDIEAWRHWSFRPLQLDYFLTRFDNGSNNHQNNLRVGMGVAYHFGGSK